MASLKKSKMYSSSDLHYYNPRNSVSKNDSSDSDVDEPDHVNQEVSSSDDSSSEEDERSSKRETDPKSHVIPPKFTGDVSDSETDIDKPPSTAIPQAPRMQFNNVGSVSKNVSSNQGDDSSESSNDSEEEQLSMSLLQKQVSKNNSSPRKNKSSGSQNPPASRTSLAGGGRELKTVRNAKDVSEKSFSESKSSPDNKPANIKREHESSSESLRKAGSPNSLRISYSESSLLQVTPFQNYVGQLQQHYTRVLAPAIDIPVDSCVWVMQIPRDVSPSHLFGQNFPTKLTDNETIGLPSSPLQLKEQPCNLSIPLNCMTSSGEGSFKIQEIHPSGYWAVRRSPAAAVGPQARRLHWGVPVAPMPVEELFRTRSKKKLPQPRVARKRNMASSSEDFHPSKQLRDQSYSSESVISPRKEKKKKNKHNCEETLDHITSLTKDYTLTENLMRQGKKRKKKYQFTDRFITCKEKEESKFRFGRIRSSKYS